MVESVNQTTDSAKKGFEELVIAGMAMTAIGNVAQNIGETIMASFTNIVQSTIEVGSTFEQTRITLGTLYKDMDIGEEKTQWMMQFAKTTPFDIESLRGSFIGLKAMGIDASEEMKMASGETQSLMAYLGDLKAFRPDLSMDWITRGLRNAAGGTIRSLDMILDINSEQLLGHKFEDIERDLPLLVQALGVEGMMGKLEGTWEQKLTNMGDSVTLFLLKIADAGLFQEAKNILGILSDALNSLTDKENEARLESFAKVMSGTFTELLQPVKFVAGAVVGLINNLIDMSESSPELLSFLTKAIVVFGGLSLGAGFLLQTLGPMITAIATFGLFMNTVGGAGSTTSILGLFGSFGKLLPLIGAVIGAFVLLKSAYDNNFMRLKDLVNYIGKYATPILENVGLVFKGVFGELTTDDWYKARNEGLLPMIEGFREMKDEAWNFWDKNKEWIVDGAFAVGIVIGIEKIASAVKALTELKSFGMLMGVLKNPALALLLGAGAGSLYLTADEKGKSEQRSLVSGDGKTEVDIKVYNDLPATIIMYNKFLELLGLAPKTLEDINNWQQKVAETSLFSEQYGRDNAYTIELLNEDLEDTYGWVGDIRDGFDEVQKSIDRFTRKISSDWAMIVLKFKTDWNDFATWINDHIPGANQPLFDLSGAPDKLSGSGMEGQRDFGANNETTVKSTIDTPVPTQGLLGQIMPESFFDKGKESLIMFNSGVESQREYTKITSAGISQAIIDEYSGLPDETDLIGANATQNLANSIGRDKGEVEGNTKGVHDTVMNNLNPLLTNTNPIGVAITSGLVVGMQSVALEGPSRAIADLIFNTIKWALGIKSPSTKTRWLGENIVYGLIEGLKGVELDSFVDSMMSNMLDLFKKGAFAAGDLLALLGENAKDILKQIGFNFGATYKDLSLPSGDVTSYFGGRESETTTNGNSSSSWHEGIDYGLAYGTPVGSAGDGEVIFAGDNGGYGLTVKVDHGEGLVSMYSHLSEILTSVGAMVKTGTVLGNVGSTGNSTGAHLHFGLYQDGVAIDPLQGFAKGTNNFVGGLALINEQGGELVNLPNGSQVVPNDKTVEVSKAQGRAEAYEAVIKRGVGSTKPQAVDNSLHFGKESVVLHVHGATDSEIETVVERLVKAVERKKELRDMSVRRPIFRTN